MKLNKQGGVDYETVSENYRAKKADLLTLPEKIPGTNCGNCQFAEKRGAMLFCNNNKVQLTVTPRMCCAFYDTLGTLRSWKKT